MNTTDDETSAAVAAAATGSAGWADATRLQRWTPRVDHADFYGLAGELVATLYRLEDLSRVLGRQVGGYGAGRVLYDDTRQVDPTARLHEATAELVLAGDALHAAYERVNRFWSAIGHIGVEDVTR